MSSPKISDALTISLNKREINEDTTIAEAIKTMQSVKYNCLLVKDKDGKGIGILSEHDIANAFADEGDEAKIARTSDFMAMDTTCARDSQTLDEIIKLMAKENIRYIPIISENGSVISFVSIMELLMAKMTHSATC